MMDASGRVPLRHTTERLVLRELDASDAPFILRLLNEPGWMRWIGDRKVRTPTDAEAYIETGPRASYAAHGFGLYLVVERASDAPVGICGLLQRDTLDAPDLGFAITAGAAGRGFATEASRAVLERADEQLHLARVLAITSPGNSASRRVLERLRFKHVDTKRLDADGDELCLFERRRPGDEASAGHRA